MSDDHTPYTSDEIRAAFLDFFHELGHEIVESSPLVPAGDSTLLFTNAGMNQFTDALMGLEQRPYNRAASSQKVMRVSGKHNDLENVGPSDRHQTFFEMLGNFSFGNYFKKEAIAFAWTFVTEVVKLPKERLWATVHLSDDDAATLWEAHLPPERILRFDKDNFWEMGDTGPCGPCSEIFYYHGPLEDQDASGVNVLDNYLEVWNLVFMQYDRAADGTLTPLPMQSIDTGMGLERITQVVQGVTNNYETDLFMPLLDKVQALLGDSDEERAEKWVGYRVIGDHARAATFLIGDGVLPGNDGRAYVLRLIMRRALRYGKLIGFEGPFLAEVAQAVIDKMGGHYANLVDNADFILQAIRQEEEAFQRTLSRGLKLFEELAERLEGAGKTTVPGGEIFRLYDTFGFPYDLTRDLATERGLALDRDGFDRAMAEQQRRSRAASGFDVNVWSEHYRRQANALPATEFIGYDYDNLTGAAVQIAALIDPATGDALNEAATGSEVDLLLDRSPFYAESGGQVADTGVVETEYGRALIEDVQRPIPGVTAHRATVVSGTLRRGENATATVDVARRWDIMRNHTATHLLHRALRNHLGDHAQQKGSLVAPDYLRFDFNHLSRVDGETLAAIEQEVNAQIRADLEVEIDRMSLDAAKARGATMLFGEKYGDEVRVVALEEDHTDDVYSMELCGGTHLFRTGQIGSFLITQEQSTGSGVRRITALTGRGAERHINEQRALLRRLMGQTGAQQPEELSERIDRLNSQIKALDEALITLQRDQSQGQVARLLDEAQAVNGTQLVAAQVEAANADALSEMADWLRDRLGDESMVLLAAVIDEKPLLVAKAAPALVARGGHAGKLVGAVAKQLGGGGGGRPDFARAGGRDATKLSDALAEVPALVAAQLS